MSAAWKYTDRINIEGRSLRCAECGSSTFKVEVDRAGVLLILCSDAGDGDDEIALRLPTWSVE